MANDLNDRVLLNFGGANNNNLNRIIESENIETNEFSIKSFSPYKLMEEVPEYLKSNKHDFSILTLNCQSLNAKFDKIKALLKYFKDNGLVIKCLCFQETWIKCRHPNDIPDLSAFHLPGYQEPIGQAASCGEHGGLAIYLIDGFKHNIIHSHTSTKNWEGLFINVTGDCLPKPIIIGNVYRPPRDNNDNSSIKTFLSEFKPVVHKVGKMKSDAIITCDNNIDLLQISHREKYAEYFDLLLTNGFFPKITFPTRFANRNATLLDQIFYKSNHTNCNTKSAILWGNISDHFACISVFKHFILKPPTPRFVKICKADENSICKFVEEVRSKNVYQMLDKNLIADPNENCKLIEKLLNESKEKHLPTRTVKFNKHRHKKSEWITMGIIKSIQFRDKLYLKLKTTHINSPMHNTYKINLKTYNSILNKLIINAKKSFYHNEFTRFKHDAKNTWSTINDLLCRKKRKSNFPSSLKLNSMTITDKTEIANEFNNYFTSVGPVYANAIPKKNRTYQSYLNKVILSKFSFTLTNKENVLKVIDGFLPKTSTGPDGLSMKLLKRLKLHICDSLTLIINQSLTTGIFPENFKIAKVLPLFKKGDLSIMENYRPISLLPCISKIFEKVVSCQVYDYFIREKLLYISQYGFRKGHSTEHACIEFLDKVFSELDNGETPISIFIDLSKAFDTIDHKILLKKLSYYGLDNISVKWFDSYLNNRKQLVCIDDNNSSEELITTGVPQGSVLGPLLFIIYINDLYYATDKFKPVLFADDTTLMSTLCTFTRIIGSDADISYNINKELDKIHEWLCANKLSLNADKTKYMIFRYPQRRNIPVLELKFNNTSIEKVQVFDFLGLTISETLDWSHHINKITNKVSKVLGIMKKIKRFVSKETLRTIYNSLALPHFYYCVLTWGFSNSRVLKLQKKAVRIICGSKYNAHADPLFKELKLLKIQDIFMLQCTKFYYNFTHNKLPLYFDNFFQRNADFHIHDTRNRNRVYLAGINNETTRKCIRVHIPNLINNLPANVKEKLDTHSLPGFTHYVKMYYIGRYSTECSIRNCYICNRS